MVSFCKRTLRNLTNKIGSGATPTGGDASYKTHGISLIRSQNVLDYFFSKDGLAFIDEKQANELNNVTLQENDVLVNITGDSVARVCQVPTNVLPARVNQHVAILRANTEKLIPAYLKYYLLNKPNKERLLSLASTGATRKALTKGMLEEFEIEIPDEEGTVTQTRIASILSALDDKIELNRRTNHTLEQMAQTLFKKYFVDDIDPDNLPEGWTRNPVETYFDISIGRTPPRKEPEWFSIDGSDIKWVSIKDMGNCSGYILETSEYLKSAAVNRFNVPIIPPNTVILSFKLTVGRVCISSEEMLSNEAIAHFVPKTESFEQPFYTYLYLKNFDFDSLGNTSSIATAVNSQSIKKMPFLAPDISVLNTFNNEISPLFNLLLSNDKEIQSLMKIRDTLLPKLMSGEIEV